MPFDPSSASTNWDAYSTDFNEEQLLGEVDVEEDGLVMFQEVMGDGIS
jgi:hypothetical protein